jgi:hypothetical protein
MTTSRMHDGGQAAPRRLVHAHRVRTNLHESACDADNLFDARTLRDTGFEYVGLGNPCLSWCAQHRSQPG